MKSFITSEAFFKGFIHIILYVVVGMVIYFIIKSIMYKALNVKLISSKANLKRQKTIHSLVTNILKYVIIFIVLVLILKEFGVNTTSLLASVGVVGLVVGLALQDTIKDFVSGIFIITDREYEVGDFVTIDGFTGEVKQLGLKTTKIRAYTGEIKSINNSSISTVVNYSQFNSNLVLDVNVDYDENSDKIIKVLNDLLPIIKGMPEVKKKVEVLGVQELDSSSVKYRMFIETKPYDYFIVRRRVLKLIKDEFEKQNIKIPYPQLEVHDGKKYSLDSKVIMKKPHACQSNLWQIVRIGVDIKLKCLNCSRCIMMDRLEFERKLKKVVDENEE